LIKIKCCLMDQWLWYRSKKVLNILSRFGTSWIYIIFVLSVWTECFGINLYNYSFSVVIQNVFDLSFHWAISIYFQRFIDKITYLTKYLPMNSTVDVYLNTEVWYLFNYSVKNNLNYFFKCWLVIYQMSLWNSGITILLI